MRASAHTRSQRQPPHALLDISPQKQRTLDELKERLFLRSGDLVVVVSDLRPGSGANSGSGSSMDEVAGVGGAAAGAGAKQAANVNTIRSVQVRHVR